LLGFFLEDPDFVACGKCLELFFSRRHYLAT
jgi:hypothetical protein